MIIKTPQGFTYTRYGSVTRECRHCAKVLSSPSPKGAIYDTSKYILVVDSTGAARCGACGNRAAIL